MRTRSFIVCLASAAMVQMLLACGSSKNAQAPYAYQQQQYMPQQQQYVPQQQAQPQGTPQQQIQPRVDPVQQIVDEYTAAGFRSQSMAFTMYESIASFRQIFQSNPDAVEIVADGIGASTYAASMVALNAAATRYAMAAGSVIAGGLERDFGNIGENYDKFHGAFVQTVASYVVPMLQEKMKFVKKSGNGYEVRVGYVLMENRAKEARQRAVDEALQQVDNGQAFGAAVRKYVQEAVDPKKE